MGKRKKPDDAETPETPEQILAAATHAQYDMLAFARSAKRTAAKLRSERFELNRARSTVDQRPIHYFRVRGETLTGVLGKPNVEGWHGGGVTYPMVLDDGSVVRIPGNRDLQREIKRLNCVHLRVTIEYLGKRYLTTAHYQKLYQIHPAPLSAESISGTKGGRAALKQIGEKAAKKKASVAIPKGGEDPKAVRRKFVQDMIKTGHKPTAKTLQEFAGEPWADKVMKEAT